MADRKLIISKLLEAASIAILVAGISWAFAGQLAFACFQGFVALLLLAVSRRTARINALREQIRAMEEEVRGWK